MAIEPILPSLHAGAFAAIPVPATLLDAKGLRNMCMLARRDEDGAVCGALVLRE